MYAAKSIRWWYGIILICYRSDYSDRIDVWIIHKPFVECITPNIRMNHTDENKAATITLPAWQPRKPAMPEPSFEVGVGALPGSSGNCPRGCYSSPKTPFPHCHLHTHRLPPVKIGSITIKNWGTWARPDTGTWGKVRIKAEQLPTDHDRKISVSLVQRRGE